MVTERPRDAPVVLGLQLVVELLADAVAQLGEDRLGVQAGRQALDERQQDRGVAQVGLDRLRDARVLDLDRHVAAVVQPRAVDLADRRRGDRRGGELREVLLQRAAEVVDDHAPHPLEGHLRRVVAQRGELGLERLALALGHQLEVDGRQDLAELHRRALHLAELRDELVGEREGALGVGRLGLLVGAQAVGDLRAGPARGLAGDEAAELGGAGEA